MRDLVQRWLVMADAVRGVAVPAAEAYERAARELEQRLAVHDDELLSLAQAGRETGYTADHLARLIREHRLQNRGRMGAPRVRRGDLTAKRRSASP